MRRAKSWGVCLASLAGLALSAGATAQTAVPSGAVSAVELPEITVTAQKREQALSDVGISVAVASAEELAAVGIRDVTDLPKITSGLTVGKTYTGYPVFSIRGVNFNASQFSAAPAVTTYLDEAPLPYGPMTAGMLFDVERVEVLKGPQGTLFGQNATGGSINVIAAKPTAQLAAAVGADLDSFGGADVDAFVSGPLSDTLRARIAVTTSLGGKWQHGYYLSDEHNGEQEKGSARALLEWTPSDELTINLNVNGFYDHSQPQLAQLASVNIAVPGNGAPGLETYPLPTNDRQAEGYPLSRYNNRNAQEALRIDWQLAPYARLTSITNYVDSKFYQPFDADGTALAVIYTTSVGTGTSFSEELRLSGAIGSGRLAYTLGGNFQKDHMTDAHVNEDLIHFSTLPPNTTLDARYTETNRAAAVFANADFEVVPLVTLTGGLRYTGTRQSMVGCTADTGDGSAAGLFGGFLANALRGAFGLPPTNLYVPGGCITINDIGAPPTFLPVLTDVSQSEHNVSWRGGVNVKTERGDLLYALASRGFKAGVFPFQDTVLESQVGPVRQEKLTSYEIGFKSPLFGHRAQLDAAVFHYDYVDKQFFTYLPSPLGPSATIVNIPKSTVLGEDLDFTALPAPGLTLRGALTHIRSRIGAFHGYDIQLDVVDFTDKAFNFAPEWSATTGFEYSIPVGNALAAFIGSNAVLNSTTYADLGENPSTKVPARTLVDARVGLNAGERWRISIWGRNLTNKYYWNTVAAGGPDTNVKYAGMPRMFGLSGYYRF